MTTASAEPSIGVRWDPRWTPERVKETAQLVESLGYDELWMVEDCFSSGGLTSSTAALAATEHIRVGVGLLPTGGRNPAIAAMEIGTLARIFPGRFMPAFGHGVEEWMLQIGARPPNRPKLLEETLETVRAIVRGEHLTYDGAYVQLREVQLEHLPQTPPPILVGTTGPRGLEIAGRVADGYVLPEVACPRAVRWASDQAQAGRSVVYSYLSIDDDVTEAIKTAGPLVRKWIASGVFPDMAEQAGIGRDGSGTMDDAMVQSIAAAGTPDDAARTVSGLWDAGAESVVLLPRPQDALGQIKRFARESLPILRSS